MKKICLISGLLFSVFSLAQDIDSVRVAELGARLQEYYKAMERESLTVQKGECDFLIESVTDSLLRQFVATDIYDHYMDSPVMGSENVAIHVYDKWFATGIVRMKSEADRIAAKVFAEFNRRSLIGEKAPSLVMENVEGEVEDVFEPDVENGRFRVLYFYDSDCSKCKVETILLNGLLSSGEYPVELDAVYVGSNRDEWEAYVTERLSLAASRHFWDPLMSSDYQRKYGVLKTPRLLLIAPDGTILGRGLDVHALEQLLKGIFAEKTIEYGGKESVDLYDGIFAGTVPSVVQVKGIADYISDRTLARGDTLMFRQMAGDYLYYLASHQGEGYKEGLKYHIDKNISAESSVWQSADDSLKVVGFARIMSDLLSKSTPGSQIPSIKVPGELHTLKRQKSVKVNLDKIGKPVNTIIFFTEGCEVCAAEKKIALERITDKKSAVLMVNMDRIFAENPSLASMLMDAFDLSSLPFIVQTDSSGTIIRRYILNFQ